MLFNQIFFKAAKKKNSLPLPTHVPQTIQFYSRPGVGAPRVRAQVQGAGTRQKRVGPGPSQLQTQLEQISERAKDLDPSRKRELKTRKENTL